MFTSLTLYFTIFSFSCFFAYMYQKNIEKLRFTQKIIYYFLILILPTIVAGFRTIGADYHLYRGLYYYLNTFEKAINYKEPLFGLISFLSYIIFQGEPWGMFLITSFLTLLFILKGAERLKNFVSIPMVLFIYYMFYYIEGFNILRQFLAMSIIFYGFKDIIDRKFFHYLILVMMATLIHNTAIITVIFYFIPTKLSNDKMFGYILFFGIVIMLPILFEPLVNISQYIPILRDYTSTYKYSIKNFDFNLIKLIGETFTFLVPAIIFGNRIKNKDNRFSFLINLSFLAFSMRILFFYFLYAWRLNYYFVMGQMLLVPFVINTYSSVKDKKKLTAFFIIMYGLFFIYYYVVVKMGPGLPYVGSLSE